MRLSCPALAEGVGMQLTGRRGNESGLEGNGGELEGERERGRERGSVRATARTRPKSKEVMRREEVKLQQDQDKVGRTTARVMMEGSEPSAAGGSLWMPKRERAVAGGGVCFV